MRNPFAPQVLETVTSKFSGEIKVIKSFGDTYISTGYLTQSGGLVKDVWTPVIKSLSRTYHLEPKTCLILGLAGGTVAKMLSDKFHPREIVGVEIDPIMIDLGKKYLGLGDIPDLEIIVEDAYLYIKNNESCIDLILVDLYIGDQLPEFVYSPKFIDKILKFGKIVVINHLFYDDAKKAAAQTLIELLKPLFPEIRLHRVLTNLMIICNHKNNSSPLLK